MHLRSRAPVLWAAALACLAAVSLPILHHGRTSGTDADWAAYNGGVDGDHYSPLTQINRANVRRLRIAWRYDTGEAGNIETNPLVIDGRLFACTPGGQIFALDAATGKRLWQFDPGVENSQPSRGFSYWTDGHHAHLFAGVMNYLYALDPSTGQPQSEFGQSGRIDLRKGLRPGEDYRQQSIALTSPGLIYRDLIIVGGRNPETHPAPPGDIRAFDVHTGKLRWRFHAIPGPGEFGNSTWPPGAWKTAGAANNWAGMTLDAQRGILYVPTGSAVFDFYGADRIGNDLFADCLIALDAATGKRLWYFQDVHHDIWDRDLPAPPALVTVLRDGHAVDAIAQTTKQGVIYLFNRVTSASLFPIKERAYPASTVPGEEASPTQPMPLLPAPFARQRLTASMLTTRTPAAHAWALRTFTSFRSDGQFVPFAVDKQTIVLPGFDGGAEWGGPAVDPATGVLYVNANEMAWTGGLTREAPGQSQGSALYHEQCALCHGENRAGSPPAFPSLQQVTEKFSEQQVARMIALGRGRMPAFPALSPGEVASIYTYLRNPVEAHGESAIMAGGPGSQYNFTGYRKFLDPDGYPAIAPPWGTLSAIDLNTGKYLWKIPLGQYPALAAQGMGKTGSENYGGPVLTASGLLFIAATVYDHKFRAFDSRTGALLWETTLPFAGLATPASYSIDGKQYIVVASSGGRDPNGPSGGSYIAFALP